MNLIDALIDGGGRVSHRRCLGYHQEVQNRLTGDVGITRGGRAVPHGVRRDRMDDWNINAKDALV